MEDVQKRFSEGAYALPAGRLSKLVQPESVKEYQAKFEGMATKVHDMSNSVMKEVYISGLKPEVQTEVLRARPETINDAFDLACMWEDTLMAMTTSQHGQFTKYTIPRETYIPPHK